VDPRAIEFFDRHFQFYDDKFEYANISGIRWQWIERIRSIYFIPIGASYTYELSIEFIEGPLDLGIGAVPISSFASPALSKRDFEVFEGKIKRLFDETREFRLASYHDELRRDGFFEYDRKAFHSDGSVSHKGRRRAIDFTKQAKATATSTKLRCLPNGSINVSTLWDRDCFHIMLNEIYNSRSTAR
jgi:hypothetical protein